MRGGQILSEEGYKYEFIIKGHISKRYLKEFDRLNLMLLAEGNTKLSGKVIDQAKLYSIISRFRDLGLDLVMLRRMDIGGD